MRYLVSRQLNESPNYQRASVKESLVYLEKLEEIGADCETLGFDPYTDALLSIQLGDEFNQYFIDLTTIDIQEYRHLLETKLLVLQNGKFDLRFLYHQRIIPTRVFDTFLVEKTLNLGLDSVRCSLKDIAFRYLEVEISKEERKNITSTLTDGLIVYGCIDVEHLLPIKRLQEGRIKEEGLGVSIDLDNRFVLVLAYIEYCGIKLDVEKWQKRADANKKKLAEKRELLNQFILEKDLVPFIERQWNLFSKGLSVTINWNSPKQVVEFFNLLGVNTKITKKGKVVDTVEQDHLKKYAKDFPIIDLYCEYKSIQKDLGTYGENWFKFINPVSGRVHTQYKQLMSTGRLSSGGKDKVLKVDLPNLQNVPSDDESRSCFIAEKGNVIIGVDYSGQEQIVLANKCLDKNLLEFYDSGLQDMHSFVASKMYSELKDVSYHDIKKNHKDKRQASKIAGFAIGYGGSPQAIADQLNVSIEQAQNVYDSYFEAFPGLQEYFAEAKKQGLEKGYILLSEVTGKKSYVEYYEDFKNSQKDFTRKFWDRYRNLKKNAPESPTFLELKEKVSKYFRKKGDIERMSLNYPIQGSSAEISKLSAVYFWQDYLLPNNLLFKVKFINAVHDENLVECPENLSKEVSKQLVGAMEKAGAKFCKRVPLKAESVIAAYWKK
jgi:twinkle protein